MLASGWSILKSIKRFDWKRDKKTHYPTQVMLYFIKEWFNLRLSLKYWHNWQFSISHIFVQKVFNFELKKYFYFTLKLKLVCRTKSKIASVLSFCSAARKKTYNLLFSNCEALHEIITFSPKNLRNYLALSFERQRATVDWKNQIKLLKTIN